MDEELYLSQVGAPGMFDDMIRGVLQDRPTDLRDYLLKWLNKPAGASKGAVRHDPYPKPLKRMATVVVDPTTASHPAIPLLQSVEWFRYLTPDNLLYIAQQMSFNKYSPGATLAREGEPRTTAFFIKSGEIKRTKLVDGAPSQVGGGGPGTVHGLLHLLNEDPSYATATAVTNVEVYELNSQVFNDLLIQKPELSKAFLYGLAKQVRTDSKMRPAGSLGTSGLKVVLFDSRSYWVTVFNDANRKFGYQIEYCDQKLSPQTAVLAKNAPVVICFVNDNLSGDVVEKISRGGVRMIAMRCAGFDRVDLNATRANNILVARVPEYSPFAVAEHAMGLVMAINRRLCRAWQRTRDHNFTLEGLMGIDLNGRTAGVLGTGRIGVCFINICLGFGMKVICYDKYPNKKLLEEGKVTYLSSPEEVYPLADIISLHVPLLPETTRMINQSAISKMKKGVIIVNCGRGALVDTAALIDGLQSEKIGGAGLDVYENESAYFFQDHSSSPIADPILQKLLQFNNVILTSHQAFLTRDALDAIANTTLKNIQLWNEGKTEADHPNACKPMK